MNHVAIVRHFSLDSYLSSRRDRMEPLPLVYLATADAYDAGPEYAVGGGPRRKDRRGDRRNPPRAGSQVAGRKAAAKGKTKGRA